MGRSGKDWKEKQQRQNRHDKRNNKRKWLEERQQPSSVKWE